MRTPLLLLALPVMVLAGGCRTRAPLQGDASAGEPATLTSAAAPESPAVKNRMRDHDAHGARMRDAVERADLEAARREAKVLADLRIEGDIAPAWRKHLDAMNVAAAKVGDAKDLAEVSRRVAAVAQTCGDCHATLGGPKPIVGDPPGEGSGVGPHMKRHQWAASRLWDGLVIPSDDAWKAGARVLTDAPLEPERLTPGKSPVPAIGKLATSVHDLGRSANVAKAPSERVAIYSEVAATCATCHQRLGAR